MDISKEHQLKVAIQAQQKRFGVNSIQILNTQQPVTYLSTGFAELDKVLGGFPIGRLTHLMGIPTSGMTTLALIALARAQKENKLAAYIDPDATFDPSYATLCGVTVNDLLLVRPPQYEQAFDMLFDITASGLPGLVVFDTASELLPANHRRILATVSNRLHPALAQSKCALLLLTLPYPEDSTLPTITALRLHIEMERWIFRGRDVRGYQVCATILKHKSGLENHQISFQIDFDINVAGDGMA